MVEGELKPLVARMSGELAGEAEPLVITGTWFSRKVVWPPVEKAVGTVYCVCR